MLKEIKKKVDEADLELDGLNIDHFMDRIVIWAVSGENMLLCIVTIYISLK